MLWPPPIFTQDFFVKVIKGLIICDLNLEAFLLIHISDFKINRFNFVQTAFLILFSTPTRAKIIPSKLHNITQITAMQNDSFERPG